MTGFTNNRAVVGTARPLRARTDKPHIWLQDGYWRANQWNRRDLSAWHKAHDFVHRLNTRRAVIAFAT